MAKVRDMTQGEPAKHIIAFALPMLMGNVFQEMYSMVDSAVVGKLVGVEALAAVGSAGWLDWLVLGLVIGLTQGFSIGIAQRFGAGDLKGMRRAVGMSGVITLISMVIVTLVSVLMCGKVLQWMNTPAESYTMAHHYLRIIFLGIPIIMCYNLFAGMLRALGDSRTPLIAMIVSSLVNVALDLLFVASFGWGVEGAALATVIGQVCSALVCLSAVLKQPYLRLERGDLVWESGTAKALLRLAVPIAAQSTVVSAGGVIMQSVINGFGVIIMAGVSAANKICGLLEMVGNSIGNAMHTYAGQNLGAGRYGRIREGVKKASLISVAFAVLSACIGIGFGRQLCSLFIDLKSANAGAVLDAACSFLNVMSIMLFSLFLLFIFRSTLQGMGETVFTVASSFLQVFMRSVVVWLLTKVLGETGIYIGNVGAWFTACVMLFIVLHCRLDRLERTSAERR